MRNRNHCAKYGLPAWVAIVRCKRFGYSPRNRNSAAPVTFKNRG